MTIRAGGCWLGLVAVAWTGTGCTHTLPTYPWVDARHALQTMSMRSEGIETLSARCRFVLSRADHPGVQLRGVLIARPPHHLRIRAWKLAQPVLDITITPAGTWQWSARRGDGDASKTQAIWPQSLDADQLARAWSIIAGHITDEAWSHEVIRHASILSVRQDIGDEGMSLICDIDMSTLTVRQCRIVDPDGIDRQTLLMDRYRMVDIGPPHKADPVPRVPWPGLVVGQSERGTFEIHLEAIEINTELPSEAFQPPRRAVKQK